MPLKNNQVITLFLNKKRGESHSKNLRSYGDSLVNYSTVIAYWSPSGQLWINERNYSPTTTTLVNKLRREAQNMGYTVFLYTGEPR